MPVLTAGTADGMPYFTMPFVEGESLRARLARGPMSETEAVTVLRDVTRALIYAHERGIVHRDIKPDNILLSGESAVVTDFGIAKAISAARGGSGDVADSSTITQVGTSLGTPAYIAPEQAAGDPGTDHRADLYALGCVAFELLAGQPPFHGRELHQLLRAHMTEVAPTVRSRVATVSQPLDALVAQCLAKTPDERPANARELLRQLERATGAASNAHAPRARSLPVVIAVVVPTAVHLGQELRGVASLDSLRTRFPQNGRPTLDRSDLILAIAYAQLGRADKAKPLITEWTRAATGPERLARWATWRAALGEVALAEGRVSEALAEFRAAANADSGRLEVVTNGATATRMARAFDKAGQADSALVWFERVTRVRYHSSYTSAPLNLPIAYRRLGELYEARGDTPKALENYRAFTKLWANADAELQPQVREVQQRIAQLVAAEARKR